MPDVNITIKLKDVGENLVTVKNALEFKYFGTINTQAQKKVLNEFISKLTDSAEWMIHDAIKEMHDSVTRAKAFLEKVEI